MYRWLTYVHLNAQARIALMNTYVRLDVAREISSSQLHFSPEVPTDFNFIQFPIFDSLVACCWSRENVDSCVVNV